MRDTLCVSALVTNTVAVPAAPAGKVQVIELGGVTLTPVQFVPFNFTVAPTAKLLPVRVTRVPPARGAKEGVTLVK